MGTWYLSFRSAEPLTLAAWAQLFAEIVGPVTTTASAWAGNPRDFYSRTIQLGAPRACMTLIEHARGVDDPEASIDPGPSIVIADGPFAEKLALWSALRSALARAGCREQILPGRGAVIVRDAEAAGETALAARLRAETVAALVADPGFHISLDSLRLAEMETVLAAHPRPETVTSLALTRCPASQLLARFSGIEGVALAEMRADDIELVLGVHPRPEVLHSIGLHACDMHALPDAFARFPNLERFSMDTGIRELAQADVANKSHLVLLDFEHSPIEVLDPDIIEVCPHLHRVFLFGTPLSKDQAKMDVLYGRWPGVEWTPRQKRPRKKREKQVVERASSAQPPKRVASTPASARSRKKESVRNIVVDAIALRPFFDALLAAPTDDAPRLEMARHLTERGDTRGEEIRESCALAEARRARIGEQVGTVPHRAPRISLCEGTLGIENGKLTTAEICAFLDCGAAAEVKTFVLSYYPSDGDGDEVLGYLARCGALPRLEAIHLDNVSLTDAGARTLARHAVGLAHLIRLELGAVVLSSQVMEELARSPRLPALRTITRSREHRPSAEEARDGEDRTAIQREDGAVVESIVRHWIFP